MLAMNPSRVPDLLHGLSLAVLRAALAAWALLALLLWAAPARAELPAPAPVPTATQDALKDLGALATARQTQPGVRVVVQPGALDTRLKLAPCARIQAYLPEGVPAWGRTRAGLRCLEGPVRWNVSLPLTVQVLARAAVLSAPLPAGTVITPEHLSEAEVDLAAQASPVLPAAALLGRTLLRALPAGQALRAPDLKVRQWFAAGDTVRIVAQGAGYAVSAEGQALTAGLEGQPSRVRTDSGRVIVGRPVGERRLEVTL
ncbi:flagella basal body P-ring formation protein FlgA [Burkholderiales bacterium JOSHI_001]|nr:flagella basal body P-ring formation protein FlgA [Burkholderiales bacterium JOSHI_001]